MKSFKKVFQPRLVLLLLAAIYPSVVCGEHVEAEGKSVGNVETARAEALADALREAVRTGAGVELVSQSQTTNFNLDFDRVFAKACGYVRSYKVLSSRLGDDGIYRVKIVAEVARGNPEIEDRLALQMLARLKKMPRVAVRIEESIKGAVTKGMAADWVQNTAREIGLQVVDLSKAQGIDNAMAKRAAILGRDKEAAIRGEGVMDTADYLIEGTVIGESMGSQSIYGSLPKPKFSLAVNLKVIDAATGNVVVVETPESRDLLISGASSTDTAAREAVRLLLDGDSKEKRSDAGWKIFRRLFAHWNTELDLGQTVRLDLAQAGLNTISKLKEELSKESQVGAVWIRSVDAEGIGVVDVESRLDTLALASRVEQILNGAYHLDRSGARFLSFVSNAAGTNSQTAAIPPQAGITLAPPSGLMATLPINSPQGSGISSMMAMMIAAVSGLSVALVAVIVVMRKKNN